MHHLSGRILLSFFLFRGEPLIYPHHTLRLVFNAHALVKNALWITFYRWKSFFILFLSSLYHFSYVLTISLCIRPLNVHSVVLFILLFQSLM